MTEYDRMYKEYLLLYFGISESEAQLLVDSTIDENESENDLNKTRPTESLLRQIIVQKNKLTYKPNKTLLNSTDPHGNIHKDINRIDKAINDILYILSLPVE